MLKAVDNFDRRMSAILNKLEISIDQAAALAGDASSRRFYRVESPQEAASRILVVFPEPFVGEIERYFQISFTLDEAGLPVPEIFLRNKKLGFLLVEDCGDFTLQKAALSLPGEAVSPLYLQAIELLTNFQKKLIPSRYPDCPALRFSFDLTTFGRELDFFLTHTLQGYYRGRIPTTDRDRFADFFRIICLRALDQPHVFCHRDYHSRNLLLHRDKLRLIDFQDARLGPYSYDLVSIVHDPYVNLRDDLRNLLLLHYYQRRPRPDEKISLDRFHRDCDMMSLQRLLKAAGTYGFMTVEKNREWYGKHLPATFQTVFDILDRYPELGGLKELLGKYTR